MDKINGSKYAFQITVGITLFVLLLANGASAASITVPGDYAKIQWAIDNATAGDTIEVHSGTYYESVNVTKQLILRGIGMPVVNSNRSRSAIMLSADGITLEGFNVTNDPYKSGVEDILWDLVGITITSNKNKLIGNYATIKGSEGFSGIGIFLSSSSNNTLIENDANFNRGSGYGRGIGIFLSSSNNNTLISNNASFNEGEYGGLGIYLLSSSNNTLIGNNANKNFVMGISLSSSNNNALIGNNANENFGRVCGCNHNTGPSTGISLYSSSNNTLIGNNASSNYALNFLGPIIEDGGPGVGISLYSSSNNTLIGNNASSNYALGLSSYGGGISLYSSSNNLIYNNIFNNTNNVISNEGLNINNWNVTKQSGTNIIGGLYLGGNFWANPSGTGFSQTCPDVNKDGICDTQYTLDSDNIDYLPLSMNYKGNQPIQKIIIDDSGNKVIFQNFDIGDNWNINLRNASADALAYQFSGTIGEGDTKQKGNDWNVWFSCVSEGDLKHGTLRHIVPGTYIVNADGITSYGKLISSGPNAITVLASDGKKGCEGPVSPVPEQSTIVFVSAGLLGMLFVLRRSK